jgi:drug/metabolite transporter (DMT)-like permease
MTIKRHAQLQVVLATAFFSTAGLFTALLDTDIWSLVFWRSAFALIFISFIIATDDQNSLQIPDLAGLVAILSSATAMIAFIASLRLTSVANVAVIHGTLPMLTTLIEWLVVRKPVPRQTILLCLAAGFGAVIIFTGSTSSGSRLAGDGLALWMTILMALMTVALHRSKTPSLLIVAMSNGLAALAAAVFSPSLTVSIGEASILACFALVQMTLGLLLYTKGSRVLPPAETSLISLAEVPMSTLWVWAAFGKGPRLLTVLGAAIILTVAITSVTISKASSGRDEGV